MLRKPSFCTLPTSTKRLNQLNPEIPDNVNKRKAGKYMTIGKFSKITAISTYTLRYYEKKGLIHVNRDSAGRRDYCESDVEWVKFIQRLKETGMLLRDIRHYSELRYEGDATMGERMELLVLHRKSVVEEKKRLDEYLKNLDGKIAFYRDNIQ